MKGIRPMFGNIFLFWDLFKALEKLTTEIKELFHQNKVI